MNNQPTAILCSALRHAQVDEISIKVQSLCDFLSGIQGLTDWEISFSYQESFSLSVRNQYLEDVDQSESSHLSIRAYVLDQVGGATCLGIQWQDWINTAHKAFKIAQLSQSDVFSALPEAHYFEKGCPLVQIESKEDLQRQDLLNHALMVEKMSLQYHGLATLQSDGSAVSAEYGFTVRANSKGLWAVIPSTSFSQSLSLLAHRDHDHESDYAHEGARQWSALSHPDCIAQLARDRTLAKLHKKNIASGDYPVVFSPRCSYTLVKHICAALSGRSQYLKSSFWMDAKGQRVLPSWLNLEDKPHLSFEAGSYPIDSDGLPTQDHRLIDQGVVKDYILSHYSALRLGLSPNGLASGLRNIYMSSNADNLQQLVARYPRCIVVDQVTGTGVSISQGTYSRGIEGFYYESGERVCALKEVTIASSLPAMYFSLEAHASDHFALSSWKIGSMAFPSIRVSSY
jgi:PmbA protein